MEAMNVPSNPTDLEVCTLNVHHFAIPRKVTPCIRAQTSANPEYLLQPYSSEPSLQSLFPSQRVSCGKHSPLRQTVSLGWHWGGGEPVKLTG